MLPHKPGPEYGSPSAMLLLRERPVRWQHYLERGSTAGYTASCRAAWATAARHRCTGWCDATGGSTGTTARATPARHGGTCHPIAGSRDGLIGDVVGEVVMVLARPLILLDRRVPPTLGSCSQCRPPSRWRSALCCPALHLDSTSNATDKANRTEHAIINTRVAITDAPPIRCQDAGLRRFMSSACWIMRSDNSRNAFS